MPAPFQYQRLGYVALSVTDLDRALPFYRDLVGLEVSSATDDYAALRCGPDHHNLLLCKGRHPGLKRIGFDLGSQGQLEKAYDYIASLKLSPAYVSAEECRQLKVVKAFRFREPASGMCLEFFISMMQMATPFSNRVTHIERLGHVVLNVKDFDKVLEFFVERLGFRISDFVPGFAAFLRCYPNPLHHSLAILAGSENRLNHVNFMVHDIDDIGKALHRMRKADVPIVFGPGRHQPSGSIFLYFLEPDRMTLEYSFGMETFPADGAREPRMLEPVPEALDQWGSLPTPEFGKVGCIESAS